MGGNKASQWVEGYLYSARGHRALEQSVLAAGERVGLSERKLRRAAQSLGIGFDAGCWELPALRCEALDTRSILELSPAPASLPAVGMITRTPVTARDSARAGVRRLA